LLPFFYTSLYIVGYSFRDEHINDLIQRWIENIQDYSKGLQIVDFKLDKESQQQFIRFVKKALHKRAIDESCFEFGGANNMRRVEGTIPQKKKQLIHDLCNLN